MMMKISFEFRFDWRLFVRVPKIGRKEGKIGTSSKRVWENEKAVNEGVNDDDDYLFNTRFSQGYPTTQLVNPGIAGFTTHLLIFKSLNL